MIFVLISNLGEGVFGTLFAPFVQHVLHGSSQAYGLVAGLQAVGGIGGGLLTAGLGHRVSAARLFIVGAIAFGAIDLAIFCYPLIYVAVWPAAVGMVVVGLPGALANAGFMTLFQRCTRDTYRGRVFGTLATLEGASILIGTASAGFLGQVVGIIPVLATDGALSVVAGVVVAGMLHKAPEQPAAGPATTGRVESA
jgi:MFS family permease